MGKAMKHWTLDDIPWNKFDPALVDPELLRIVKAASMVEYNGGDYVAYLCNVFADDPAFQEVAREWAVEEVQHGAALARWATLADPGFDFEESFGRFKAGFRIPVGATRSIRGSRSGELVARCIVETGTSSYYTALMEAAKEPVLKEICRNIAADELRHYKLFYVHLKRYLERERIGRWRRALVALRRITETEDDELAYAYYAANGGTGADYDRKRWSRAYARRAYGFYRRHHIQRGIAMGLKAAGLTPNGRLNAGLTRLAAWFMARRVHRLARAGA
jgi:rubrerythrin